MINECGKAQTSDYYSRIQAAHKEPEHPSEIVLYGHTNQTWRLSLHVYMIHDMCVCIILYCSLCIHLCVNVRVSHVYMPYMHVNQIYNRHVHLRKVERIHVYLHVYLSLTTPEDAL
jgi:hypothetical protein